MSQQTAKPGRRTPLSLGQPKGDASDKGQIRTSKATVNLEKLSTELLAKQAKNGAADDSNKAENGQNNATNNGSTAKKDGNGVHIDEANDKSKLTDKVKDIKVASPKVNEKVAEKAKPANDKVAEKAKPANDKVAEKAKPANDKVVEKAKPSNDKVQTTINDKQKPSVDTVSGISKTDEKVDAKNGDKEVRESVRQKQLREEKEKEDTVKVTPISQPTKTAPSTPDKNSESSNVKEKRKIEVATPTKTPKQLPSESLLAEKSLKGFNENLEEAESSKITDSPMPAKDSKLLKFSQAPPMSASRKRSDKLEDASLVVNLSTVSELSNESTSNSGTPVERNYSLRHITGRRSLRPLRELSFDYRKRESYYKERNESADSIVNINVTSSSESPRVGGQFKRTVDDDEVASPKRSRFDFGLLEFVSSPVKKLGAKFSRSQLSTSTPNKLTAIEDIPSGIEGEAFAAEEDDDLATVELNAVDEEAVEKKIMEIDTDIPAEADEAPIEVHEPSKSRCSVM